MRPRSRRAPRGAWAGPPGAPCGRRTSSGTAACCSSAAEALDAFQPGLIFAGAVAAAGAVVAILGLALGREKATDPEIDPTIDDLPEPEPALEAA